jgi:hypothetical protein
METEMKPPLARVLITAACLAAAALCACAPKLPPPTVETTVKETPTGAEVVETVQITGAVVGINYDTRQIVLRGPAGGELTYKADKSAVNFDKIKVGYLVKLTVTEKIAVNLSKEKAPESAGIGATVVLAPKGAMPGGVVADTAEVTATVAAVDAKARKVTLNFVDGSSDTVAVGKAVDLTKVTPGDTVTARLSESIAIAVERS